MKSESDRTLRRPPAAWIGTVVLLLFVAILLRPCLAALAEHYRKEAIALRVPLEAFDLERLPSFLEAPPGSSFPVAPASEEALGTRHLLQRSLKERNGRGLASLTVAYYSDPHDKVPHTPDVCYRQAGTVVENLRTITIATPDLGPEYPHVQARAMTMVQDRASGVLVYLFVANGDIVPGRNQARWIIARPGARHVYFSKVEVMASIGTTGGSDSALARCEAVIREVLPVLIAEHFPRREDLWRR
jgi:hypothetical protein